MDYQIVIVRTGECKRCGWCCGFRDGRKVEGACIHLTDEGLCSIYHERDKFCEACGRDHKNCIIEPSLPINKENPNCGYRFFLAENGAMVLAVELG